MLIKIRKSILQMESILKDKMNQKYSKLALKVPINMYLSVTHTFVLRSLL